MKKILNSLVLASFVFFTSNCFADANDVNDVIIQQGSVDAAYGTGYFKALIVDSNVLYTDPITHNIGIGITSPGAKLEVAGNIACAEPTANNHAATKGYVDNLTNSSSILVQTKYSQTQTYTNTTSIPFDDTIPQQTEGTQILTVSITPTSATNILRIDAVVSGFGVAGSNTYGIAAIFKDSNNNALASGFEYGDGYDGGIKVTYFMSAGTTSLTTFKLRCGNISVNGWNGQRRLGGSVVTSLTVTEFRP